MQWNQVYGGTRDDDAHSVIQTSDGGYAIAGETNSFGAGGNNAWLVKTDSSGNMQWNETYGGAGSDEAYSVVKTSDEGYAIAGGTTSFGATKGDFWLVKTDASGILQWNETYGGVGGSTAQSITQTNDGGFALAGYVDSSGTAGTGKIDFYLVKTNPDGSVAIPEFPSIIFATLLLIFNGTMIIFVKRRSRKSPWSARAKLKAQEKANKL